MIQSPLNYTGGKYKLLPQILPLFPANIETFVDLFCGGCNVGVNVAARRHIYNDLDKRLPYLYNTFKNLDKEVTFELIYKVIDDYGLSLASKHGYAYYNCESGSGLAQYNRARFIRLRDDFNNKLGEDYYYYIMLYVLIVYAFNNQIRFNSKGEYNLPAGKRDFNDKMAAKLSAFIDVLKAQSCKFICGDFRDFDIRSLTDGDFVYLDPPYLITCATYNEKDGWNEKDETDLYAYIDSLDGRGIRFALSNVMRSKGRENRLLMAWTEANADKYKVTQLSYSYSNSNYHIKDKRSGSDEVLITNY